MFKINHKSANNDPTRNVLVAGVGAAAGGIEALQKFFFNVPGNDGIAYVIAKHHGASQNNMLENFLRQVTPMPITKVTDNLHLRPNEIYILPCDYEIFFQSDEIQLGRRICEAMESKPSINCFLTALAEAKGERSIGIVLSGSGDDGAQGMRAIKAVGGITVVQDPKTAKYNEMPIEVMAAVNADLVLPSEKMGAELSRIINSPVLTGSAEVIESTPDDMDTLMLLLRTHTGCDFSEYKESTIYRRISRRLALHKFNDIQEYIAFVSTKSADLKQLAKDILISVTRFFRDKEAFETLKRIIPDIVSASRSDAVRIWVPACATGEEVYSLAILFTDYFNKHHIKKTLQFFATDIDTEAVARARKAFYPESSLLHVDRSLVKTYFKKELNGYQVEKSIRELIVFARQDIISDPPFCRIDLIVCRNLLIYFNPALQSRLMAMFHYALNPDGILFLGKSESLGQYSGMFSPISKKWRLFRRNETDKRYSATFKGRRGLNFNGENQLSNCTEKKPPSLNDVILKAICEGFGLPSVLISDRHELLYVKGDISRFFQIGEGNVGLNIFDLARKEIRSNLRASAHKAVRENMPVVNRAIRMENQLGDGVDLLTIHARPVCVDGAPEGALLLSFETEAASSSHELEITHVGDLRDQHIIELEQELAGMRERLQSTVEELETANEELHSLNEELQSINEELETSNEELQATNEELITVNEELQLKSLELSEANTDLENVFKRMGIPLIVVDKSLGIRRFTPAVTSIFNIMSGDQGQRITTLKSHVHIPDFEKMLWDVIENGRATEQKLDTGSIIYEFKIFPYYDESDRINGALITFYDITDRIRAEAEGVRRQKMESLGNLAGGIAHDFNNCLASVIGYAELSLDQNMDGEDCSNELTQIIKSGMRAKDMVRQILTFSQKAPFKKEPISINLVARDAVKMLQATLPKSIDIETRFPTDEMIVEADISQIHQVVMNLSTNAVDAIKAAHPSTENGVITIEIDHLPASHISNEAGKKLESGEYLHISVSDTGTGIPDDLLEKMFDPYFTTKKTGEGSGLGLSVVHGIVQSLQGEIVVDSALGTGSTFHIYLPLMEIRLADSKAGTAEVLAEEAGQGDERILFVDDEIIIAELQNALLRRLGYQVDVFTDSLKALENFKNNPEKYDLVITDMEMPKMRGDQFAGEIKTIRPSTPVIMCTGHSERLLEIQQSQLEIEAFILKPVKKNDMAATIRNVLDENQHSPLIS